MPAHSNDAEHGSDTETAGHYITVAEHNTRIKWFREVSLVTLVRRAVIYEVHSTRPRMVLIPARDDWDSACGAPPCTEDLDTDPWFGDQQTLHSLYTFPGTTCRLSNSFDLITLRPGGASHHTKITNRAVRRTFDVDWIGNLLVVKRGRYQYNRAVSITRPEISMINTLVHRWLQIQETAMDISDDDLC